MLLIDYKNILGSYARHLPRYFTCRFCSLCTCQIKKGLYTLLMPPPPECSHPPWGPKGAPAPCGLSKVLSGDLVHPGKSMMLAASMWIQFLVLTRIYSHVLVYIRLYSHILVHTDSSMLFHHANIKSIIIFTHLIISHEIYLNFSNYLFNSLDWNASLLGLSASFSYILKLIYCHELSLSAHIKLLLLTSAMYHV